MDKKFLDKVIEQLKRETKFESREDGLYWSYPFFPKLTILKPYFTDNKNSHFYKHSRNVYGLKNEEEIEIDIMFGLKIDRISSISDIRFVIDNSFIDRGDIVKFCQNYFQPMNYKSIMDVIDKNGF